MATLREIEDALRAADAAGNREDVLALADERDRLLKRTAAAEPSIVADMAKSAAFAPFKAAVGMAGLPGTVRELAQAGKQKLLSYLPESVGKLDAAMPSNLSFRNNFMASAGDLRGLAEKATGPWYDPQTRAGKVADTAAQTALMMGRNWATAPKQAAQLTAGVTAGTEGVGALTNDNPVMRMLGGALGGAGPAVSNAARSRVGQVVHKYIGTPTQAEIDAALAIQAQGRAQGVPLLGTESLDNGAALASFIRSSPAGNRIVEGFINKRPEQVTAAVERGLLAPTGPRAVPEVNAARAQTAATKVIDQAEAARTAATSPFYKAAENDMVPPRNMLPVADQIQALIRQQPIDSEPALALNKIYRQAFPDPAVAASPETRVSVLGNLYKNLGIQRDMPSIGASPEAKQASYPAGKVQDVLGDVLRKNSANWKQGNAEHARISREQIDPLRASPIGVIAGKTGYDPAEPSAVPRVTQTIANKDVARVDTIRDIHTRLNKVDPQAFPGMAQTYIENELNAASKINFGGPNPAQGVKFMQAIAGTTVQKKNFEEVMRGVAVAHGANPDELVKGANNLLQVLERTGRTPGIGSPTQPRLDIAQELGKTKLGDAVGMISTSPMEPARVRWGDRVRNARSEQIAKVLTAEDSVQTLLRLAKVNPNGITASYLAASLLGLDEATAGP